ncbi:MAG TPA: hypothetical protein VIY28_08795 [Pseudonocardiaceae bacterium]
MTDTRGDERPQWLDVAVTVLPPVSLITALLVYFAWVRRAEYARALRFDVGLMEGSILDYLLRSVDAVFLPLLIALVGFLLWLGVDGTVRRWARNGTHQRAVSRVSWALPVGGAALIGGTVLVGMVSSVAHPYVSVAWPFLAALAVLAAAYGASLRRLSDRKAGGEDSIGHRWAINAVVGLLVAMLLFEGMDGFAKVVGRGLAKRIIEQPNQYTQSVLLYSAQDLQLDSATATKQELPAGEHTAYHYRYEGLRLIFVDGGYFFLIGRTWRSRGGTLIVLPRDGLRIEFPRGATQ